ncbi:phosphotransferase [Galactobacter caseinivorans]|uniref:Aminoglycoside phosphotransferase family protein n=1 Tax=Galactobacter caseinivorans TaxID=2676123 RepID=A0A496PLG6_9MICC|nr:phosphotransferase [Galactobacter caseinivorans]RKW71367.1 aminoglycoside phosphotransferase family protein [Galactobacter caseinivorans]
MTQETGWDESHQVQWMSSPEFIEVVLMALEQQQRPAQSVHLVDLHHRPGAGVSVVLEAVPTDGEEPFFLGATTEPMDPAPEHVMVLSDREPGDGTELRRVLLWLHPYDPKLPGLALTSVPASVERIWGAGSPVTQLETLAYRPLRRAVLRATFKNGQRLYLKALHRDADSLHRRHSLLLEAGVPAPAPVGQTVHGVVALREAEGESLALAMSRVGTELPDAADLLALLDRLPHSLLTERRRESWSDRLPDYADAASVAFPSLQGRIVEVSQALTAQLAAVDPGPEEPVHGDLYEANVFVKGHRVSGLLDVDGAGPGYRVDDLACLLAHLAVLPQLDHRYQVVPRYAALLDEDFVRYLRGRGIAAAALHARVAAVVLTLVAGVHDEGHEDAEEVATQRVAIAEAQHRRAAVDLLTRA